MFARPRLWSWGASLLLAVAGCKNARPIAVPVERPERSSGPLVFPSPPPAPVSAGPTSVLPDEPVHEGLQLASYQEPAPQQPRTPLGERLKLPVELPGTRAPLIELPRKDPERKQAIDRHFPALPSPEAPPPAAPGPAGKPLTLADLQQLARSNSPTIRQAAAAVEAAQGVAVQVGLYPNPRVGYQSDTITQANSAGLQGGFIEQTLKTGHKLKLARTAAQVDVENADLALRRAEIDLTTQVRRGFFNVLTARRALDVGRAYAGLTGEVYAIQVSRLRVGEAAVYEVLQARVLATQARVAIVQVHNRYLAEWQRLTATLGMPEMPLTELAGDVDLPVPRFEQLDVLPKVLEGHTDVRTAANSVTRAQAALRLAEVLPLPDLDLKYLAQRDNTTPPFGVVHSVALGIQVPVFNHNQGGIREAQANLARANEEPARVRNELTAQVAAAFLRYDNARALVLTYRDQLLPDQVRAYRSIFQRYDKGETAALNFNDIITSQQTLADAIRNYLEAIGGLWDAVVDVANLLQLDDLLGDGGCSTEEHDVCPIPRLVPLRIQALPDAESPETAALRQVAYTVEEPTPTALPAPDQAKKVRFEVWQLKGNRRIGFRVCTY